MQIKITMRYYLTLVKMTNSKKKKKKIYKQYMLETVWRKGNPLALLMGMQIGTATMENTMEIP